MLSERLKILRAERGITQADLAIELGVSKQAYSLYEPDRREMDFSALCRLADYFNVSVDYLLERSSDTTHKFCDEEVRLIFDYRSLDERGKEAIKNNVAYEVSRNAKANTTKKSAM